MFGGSDVQIATSMKLGLITGRTFRVIADLLEIPKELNWASRAGKSAFLMIEPVLTKHFIPPYMIVAKSELERNFKLRTLSHAIS